MASGSKKRCAGRNFNVEEKRIREIGGQQHNEIHCLKGNGVAVAVRPCIRDATANVLQT